MDTPSLIRGIGFVLGGALFWVLYFDFKDRLQPEPRRLLLAAFGLGMVSALVASFAYDVAPWLGFPSEPGGSPRELLAYCLFLIGPAEEGAKFLVLALIVTRWKAYDEPVDGIIYAGAIAIGFATLENLIYLPRLEWPEQLVRSAVSPLVHSLFAACFGYGVSRARFGPVSRLGRISWPLGGLAVAATLHGIYDYSLFAWQVTLPAAVLVLGLWIVMLASFRRLLPRVEPAPDPGA